MIKFDNDLAQWFSEEIFVTYKKAKTYQRCLPEHSLIKIRHCIELIIEYLSDDASTIRHKSLFERIEYLQNNHIINSNISSLLHSLRKLSNTGAHQPIDPFLFGTIKNNNAKANASEAVKTFCILLEDLYLTITGKVINNLKVINTELDLEQHLFKVFIVGERDLQTLTHLVMLLYAQATSDKNIDVFLLNRAIDIAKTFNVDCPDMSLLIGEMLLNDCFDDRKLDEGIDFLRTSISLGNIDACVKFSLVCGGRHINVEEVKKCADEAYKTNVFESFNLIWRVYNGSFQSVPMNINLCIEALEKGAKGHCEWAMSFNCQLAYIYTEKEYGIYNFKKAYACIQKLKLADKKMAAKIEKIVRLNFIRYTQNVLHSSTLAMEKKLNKSLVSSSIFSSEKSEVMSIPYHYPI